MKISNFVIIFFVAVFAYVCLLDSHVNQLSAMSTKYVQYNNAVDTAIDDALFSVIESADGTSLSSNLEGCLNVFYKSLYSSFGALDNTVLQQDLQIYTPVIAIADVDGFYIIHNSTNAEGKLVKVWTQKMPYTMAFDEDINGRPYRYTITVTLGDEIVITFAEDSGVYKGKYSELQTKYDDTFLSGPNGWQRTILAEEGTFINWKNHYISEMICEQMNHYANLNNTIASDFGIKYNFTIPETASTELANGISDVTLMVLFQGYPFGVGTDDVFNKFCIGGSKVTKVHAYYVRPFDDGGGEHFYYHKGECREMFDATTDTDGFYSTENGLGYAFSSALEAASSGALPCPYCCY